jgi:hypothetical protein
VLEEAVEDGGGNRHVTEDWAQFSVGRLVVITVERRPWRRMMRSSRSSAAPARIVFMPKVSRMSRSTSLSCCTRAGTGHFGFDQFIGQHEEALDDHTVAARSMPSVTAVTL